MPYAPSPLARLKSRCFSGAPKCLVTFFFQSWAPKLDVTAPKACLCAANLAFKKNATLTSGTFPETNSSPLKMDAWNTTFLLGSRPIFRGYVSFREGNLFHLPLRLPPVVRDRCTFDASGFTCGMS